MDKISAILWLSVFFQAVAVYLALRVIPIAAKPLAWGVLAFAFFLMTMRRSISLLHKKGILQSEILHAFTTEIVALIISLTLCLGIFFLSRIFKQRLENEDELKTLIQAIEQSPVGIIITNTEYNIDFLSRTLEKKFAILQVDCVGKHVRELDSLINPIDTGKAFSFGNFCEHAVTNNIRSMDISYVDSQNQTRYESISISPVEKNDVTTNYILVFEDFTEKVLQEKQLEHLALYDSLTQLPNRTLFMDRLALQISNAKRARESFSVLMLDLDRFKEVNDTLGHAIGDQLLMNLGPKLKRVLRQGDTIARMGGDEFLLLLPRASEQEVHKIAEKLLSELSNPIIINDYTLDVGASVGCVIFPQHGDDIKSLLSRADVAMYHAKHNNLGYKIYNSDIDKHTVEKLGLVSDLRHAIANDELHLVFQPKIDLKTEQCIGVESLSRWTHKTRGAIPPDIFIPIAEQAGFIKGLTHWVIGATIKQRKIWADENRNINVSINLSAKDLHDPTLPRYLDKTLQENKVTADKIILEITESTIMTDIHTSLQVMLELSNMGFQLSIDDFGTGYSSLEYLTRLPVDELKIDRSFVGKMILNQNEMLIVRSTIELAHNLGLKVVAEGVEEKETLDTLKELNCDIAQGFYFSEPKNAEQLFNNNLHYFSHL